jgi:branched-chain amino acid transport system permease protein
MVLLGGTGTLYGPILAAFLITFTSEALVGLGLWRFLIISAGMILVLVVLPGGVASLPQLFRRRTQ